MPILNGEFQYRGYTSDKTIKVSEYDPKMNTAVPYEIDTLELTWDDEGKAKDVTMTSSDEKLDNATVTTEDNLVTITTEEGYKIELDISGVTAGAEDTTTTISTLSVDLTGIGAMRLQIGANEGQVLEIPVPDVSLRHMGISEIEVSTKDGAQDALERIGGAISYISQVRSELGALQNRLENSVDNLDITYENMTSSYSRIMDVDMAEEMSEYTKNQILTQAGTSMLAQANERPSQVLQLLQ